MASTIILLSLLFLLCSTFMPSKSSHSINDGFTIPIILRDSPKSPLYNHSTMTLSETRTAQFRRSISRIKHLSLRASASSFSQSNNKNPPNTSTKLIHDTGSPAYIASYFIGTPPTKVFAFVDTGSDTIWTKRQVFHPSKSRTYQQLNCSSDACQLLHRSERNCTEGPRTYIFQYGDTAKTTGVFSYDNFSFGPPAPWLSLGFLNFGVSSVSSEKFTGKQDGCLALNRGPLSFISQLGIKMFSHCLVPREKASESTLSFGSKAVIRSEHLTPLVENGKFNYYVNLEGISIGKLQVPIQRGAFEGGGFLVDSGTSHTMLTPKAYDPFLEYMKRFVTKQVPRPPTTRIHYELCFNRSQIDLSSIPLVTFHFARGVNVKLTKEATFGVYPGGIWCLTILRSPDDKSVFGSLQMINLNVGYDLRRGISFTQTDCTTSTG